MYLNHNNLPSTFFFFLLFLSSSSPIMASGLQNGEREQSAICQIDLPLSSSGLWMHNNPLQAKVPLLMVQITLIVAISKLLHLVFLRRLRLPAMVSQILTGILLGPSVLGHMKYFDSTIFPQNSMIPLRTFANMSMCMFFFTSGVKTDIGMIWRSGKKAMVIAFFGITIPLLSGLLIKEILKEKLPEDLKKGYGMINFLVFIWPLTSFVVISDLLGELKLLNCRVGRLAISATLVSEMLSLLIFRTFKSMAIGISVGNLWMGFGSLFSFMALTGMAHFAARPVIIWAMRRTPKGHILSEAYFLVIIMLCLGFGLASEAVGHTVEMGMFILWLALPGGPPLGTTLVEKLEGVTVILGMPVFFANLGLKTDVTSICDAVSFFYLQFFVLFIHLIKFVTIFMVTIFFDIEFTDALVVALIMCYKGVFELRNLNLLRNNHTATTQTWSVMVVYFILQATILVPMIQSLYDPSHKYKSDRMRTIRQANHHLEMKVLTFLHTQEEVVPMVELVDLMHTPHSCLCVYVLHLVELVGHAMSMLAPYGKHNNAASLDSWSKSTAIVNAFRYLEAKNDGYLSVHPFISVSPHSSMHDDICTLAMDKRVSMVIFSFHKRRAIDGTLESTFELRSIHRNILDYATCTIGILVGHGKGGNKRFSCKLVHKVVVYFIGGPDDREAIALAMRMAMNPRIEVSVTRFLAIGDEADECTEEFDEEAIEEFTSICAIPENTDRVAYKEKHVKDAEAMIDVIRDTSSEIDLVIVGRREGQESYLTEGLSSWNDCPELGVIGDILASMKLLSHTSILVVQQQK